MLTVRRAQRADAREIERLLVDLELADSLESTDGFIVAEVDDEVVAISKVDDCGDFFYLSHVGVRESHRGAGIAGLIIDEIASRGRPVYVYTIIPEFFQKFGFVVDAEPPVIPTHEQHDCDACKPEKCRCMVLR